MAKVPFNVDAYTAKLIGRENVSKLDGAILELVKNTYDADASICILYYEKTTDTLYIGDNGTGMTEDVILKHWMTIGSSSKKTYFKTKQGRIQTGAKGIGRFALDRIADNCSLLTISEEEHLMWNVDWNVFEFGQKITDITAELDESELSFSDFCGDLINDDLINLIEEKFTNTGSIFKLTNLRDTWDKSAIDSISSNLRTLIPPEFKEVFNIFFFEEDTTIGDAALLQDGDEFSFDYRISFSALENGHIKIETNREEFDFGDMFDKVMSEAGFDENQQKYFRKTPIVIDTTFTDVLRSKLPIENTIGNFSGTLYFAKLDAKKAEKEKYYYKDITGRPDIRKTFGGVRIYRDGFRVRPYGDPDSTATDWLMLSSRKNRSPAAISHPSGAWRVNSDQMHGSIYISRTNISLPDQANRQGIVETKEFLLLQQFMQQLIGFLERDRQFVCRKLNEYYDKKHPTAPIKKELEDKLKTSAKQNELHNKNQREYQPLFIEVEKASALLEEKDKEIEQLETELQILRVLATTGIVTNTYVHEIKGTTHKLKMYIISAKEALEIDNDTASALESINEANRIREFLNSWFKVTVESVNRDKRKMRDTNINELLSKVISDWETALLPKNININYKFDEITFKCFPYEMESIISNLVSNSVAAFRGYRVAVKTINICIKATNTGIIIEYSDNGAGLAEAYRKAPQMILEAFESNKKTPGGQEDGTGMGMWIVNRIANDYNGTIDLSENKKHDNGFYINIILNGKRLER